MPYGSSMVDWGGAMSMDCTTSIYLISQAMYDDDDERICFNVCGASPRTARTRNSNSGVT